MAAWLVLSVAPPLGAQTWRPIGPPGGDVRTLAVEPGDSRRIYLGTSDGHIFGSRDAGEHWELLGRAGVRLDSVVAAIVVDPRSSRTLYAATWTQDPAAGGGVFRSADGGRTWRAAGLTGHAVRALAQAFAAPDVLVAGALDGIYRSADAGKNWERISPPGHEEIRNLDAVAVDARNPEIIYAGTFHLPWKTTDGGHHWFPVHNGMIDDSDVMSILVDRSRPDRVYASACSGIYRSENGAALWKKIQGIPFSARRTHALAQDPQQPATVYAATTEGLWKTTTAGAAWQRVTPQNWVINAVVISEAAPHRVVIGAERLGVLLSDDGGQTFRAANDGFFHRQIIGLALDRERPGRLLAVLANAPEPLLATEDSGRTWAPLGAGLRAENLLRVYAAPDGWWAALERGGLMRYDSQRKTWLPAGGTAGASPRDSARQTNKRRIPGAEKTAAHRPRSFDRVVGDMTFSREAWYAATDHGLLISRDAGHTWSALPVGPLVSLPVRSVRVSPDGQSLWVVSLRGLVFSSDAGKTWSWHDLPLDAGGAQRLDVAPETQYGVTLVAAADHGLYISRDAGKTWQVSASGLPEAPLQDFALTSSVYLAAMRTGGLYISYDHGQSWSRIEGAMAAGHFPVVTTLDRAATVFAASSTEGVYTVELTAAVPALTFQTGPVHGPR